MKISSVGGVIAAASNSAAYPLLQLETMISSIRRIVVSLKQAGVFPIVVVTGAQEGEVRYQLSANGMVFLLIEETEAPELIESARLGLSFLENKCEKIIFAPVNIPLFSPNTLDSLIQSKKRIATPSYQGKGGYPVCLETSIISKLLAAYKGVGGLRQAVASMEEEREWVSVEDPGILLTIYNRKELEEYIEVYNKEIIRPIVQLNMEHDSILFNTRTKLLLVLIAHTHSVRGACNLMSISYSNGWDMLNRIEHELGYLLVNRKHGGSKGGRTDLTKEGYDFLKAYQKMEENVSKFTKEQFKELLLKPGIV